MNQIFTAPCASAYALGLHITRVDLSMLSGLLVTLTSWKKRVCCLPRLIRNVRHEGPTPRHTVE